MDRSKQQRDALQKSVLDFIADDAKRMQSKLGRNDNQKLDEYLTGVREIERRIGTKSSKPVDVDVDYAIPDGIPGDYQDHMRLMCDMMCWHSKPIRHVLHDDVLRNAGDKQNYRKIGVPDGHHICRIIKTMR